MVTAVLLAGFIQSLILLVFLFSRSRTQPLFWPLTLVHAVFSADLILLIAEHEQWLNSRLNASWALLYPVLFFLFIRACLTQEKITRRAAVHFIPWLAISALIYDFSLSPDSVVITTRHWIATYLILLVYLIYNVAAIRMVWRYQVEQKTVQANLSRENLWLMWGVCAGLIVAISTIPLQVAFNTALPLPQLFVSLFVFLVTYLFLVKPELLNFEPLVQAPTEECNESELDVELGRQVSLLMDSKQLYLKSDLNLQSLAKELGVKPYLLTQVLNQQLGIKFYDLVNQKRVIHVCELIKQKPHKSVLDLAFESGFSSKSTFNSAFKKYKECTPTQYKSALERLN